MQIHGKKTYILAAAAGLLTAAHALGWIDNSMYDTLLGVLGAGGLATLRHGIGKKN